MTTYRWGGQWTREAFRKAGIEYAPKSNLFRDVLPPINSGRAELLERQRLVSQFAGLERRVARGGRDSIDHAPRGMLTPAMSHELTRFCLTAGEDDQKPYWAGRVF